MLDICERIIAARGGDLIVDIKPVALNSPSEAACLFGLFDSPEIYSEVSKVEAQAVLVTALTKDMAYNSPLVPLADATKLAAEFIDAFGKENARYYTNGDYGRPRSTPGASWIPATEHTFDTGVLIVASKHAGCAWFMDED